MTCEALVKLQYNTVREIIGHESQLYEKIGEKFVEFDLQLACHLGIKFENLTSCLEVN